MSGIFLLNTLDSLKKVSRHRMRSDRFLLDVNDRPPKDEECRVISTGIFKFTEPSPYDVYERIGRNFVKQLMTSNYEAVIHTLGKDYKHFLNGFHKFQSYMKFSFPNNENPIFILEAGDKNGMKISLICHKKELISYAKGMFMEIGMLIYKKNVRIIELTENQCCLGTQIDLQLFFKNQITMPFDLSFFFRKNFSVNPKIISRMFPFSIIISTNMEVKGLGISLLSVIPFAIDKKISENFKLNGPWIPYELSNIMMYSNHDIDLLVGGGPLPRTFDNDVDSEKMDLLLRLKGKLFFMRRWRCLIFLGAPVVPSLSDLTSLGLHICDLAIHDSSRDFMLAEAQQTLEFKLTFEQGEEKQKKLERSLIKLEEEMKRTQTILHYLVPEKSAISLRKGTLTLDLYKMIENVTILVSDIVKFTVVCSSLKPMEVVTTLNSMYSGYDKLTAKHGVCKVETVGDAYMVVSNTFNMKVPLTDKVCDVALDMIEAIRLIKNPETGSSLKVRIGINTGPAVAGIVGLKVPKFCIFGSSVKAAVILEASSLPMKIKISQSTRCFLNSNYKVSRSVAVYVQDKVKIDTYWLLSRETPTLEEP